MADAHVHTRQCKLFSATSTYPIIINNDTSASSDKGHLSSTSNIVTLASKSSSVPNTLQSLRQSVFNAVNAKGEEVLGFIFPNEISWFNNAVGSPSHQVGFFLNYCEAFCWLAMTAQGLFCIQYHFPGTQRYVPFWQ